MNRIIAAAVLFQCAHGLLQALTPLRLHEEGASVLVIGWVAAAHGLGFVCGCVATPLLLSGIRVTRVMAGLSALAAAASLALTLAEPLPGWLLLRIVTGFATAGLYTISDAWMGTEPDRKIRSIVLSRYVTVTKVAAILAPAGILLMPVTQSPILLTTALMFGLCALPVLLAKGPRAQLGGQLYAQPLFLLRLAPVLCIGAFGTGLLNGSIYALAPVYLSSLNIADGGVAIILSAFQVGGILSQIVVWKHLAKREGVKALYMLYVAVAGVSLTALALSGGTGFSMALVLFLILGSVTLLLYPVALHAIYDRVTPGELVPAAGAMLLWMALGNLSGPVICGEIMHRTGPESVMTYLAGTSFALLAVSVFVGKIARGR